jgi:hypothetical protein
LIPREVSGETLRMPDDRDRDLRAAAAQRVRELQRHYDDLVPVEALRHGFSFRGRRVSFGSFYSGIFRPEMTGPAVLSLVTAAPKQGRPAPYEDAFDKQTGRFTYRFRDPQGPAAAAARAAEADHRALLAAHDLAVPVIDFRGIAAGQYAIVAPVFVAAVDPVARLIEMESGLPIADSSPAGLVSNEDMRRYATREALFRLHPTGSVRQSCVPTPPAVLSVGSARPRCSRPPIWSKTATI